MNKSKLYVSMLVLAVFVTASPVSAIEIGTSTEVRAQVKAELRTGSSSTSTKVRAEVKANIQASQIEKIKERANKEIDRRIEGLTKLKTRIDNMRRVATTTKTQIKATVDLQITNLTTLKAKIAADTDITVLRTDVKSITQTYRIYALIMPQVHILAAADRVMTTADTMTALGVKLQTRITETQTAGKDVTTLNTLLTAYNAKIADAKVQAQAAITLTASLTPDNSDEAKFQANKKALTDARAKLRLAEQDLKAARENARKIINELKKLNPNASASTTLKVKADKQD